uniref:protein disulfide-isomerase n=1 Tax=Spermophilus dauricus TaxID=99837 RepID=A0A8C9QEW9_SPEDA
WLKRRVGCSATRLEDEEGAQALMDAGDVVVIGFFQVANQVRYLTVAPWCSHCKEMAPAWEALAEKYRDHEDIIIAELDATANELEAFTVSGFPRLLYFPAGRDRKMMEYKGNRDLESFSKFLDSGGELPAEGRLQPDMHRISAPRGNVPTKRRSEEG